MEKEMKTCPVCLADVKTHTKGPVMVTLLTGENVDLSVWLKKQEEEKNAIKLRDILHAASQNWLLWYSKQPDFGFCKIEYKQYPLFVRIKRKLYLVNEIMKRGFSIHPLFWPLSKIKIISFFSLNTWSSK
jgi:hypothetical protein